MLLISKNARDKNFISNGKTRIPTEYREKGIRCFKNCMFRINCFIDCQFNTFPFEEYNNFRKFKVSYKDTRTIFLLLSLIRFHTSFGGLK